MSNAKVKITANMIKELRAVTSAGVLDCRKALEATDGDAQKAAEWLREKGIVMAANRSDREASNGMIEIYSHGGGRVGVMVEVNCETDFVARSEQFRTLAHEIALQIAASAPRYVRPEDIPDSELEREADKARARGKLDGKSGAVLDKIVEGYLDKYRDETCLLRQMYIRDESMTVEKLVMQNVAATGESIVVRRFQRWELGEITS
jgi:elongation factor Ts